METHGKKVKDVFFVLIDPNKHSTHSFTEYMDKNGDLCSIEGNKRHPKTGEKLPRRWKWSRNQRTLQVPGHRKDLIEFIKGYPLCLGSPNAPAGAADKWFIIAEVNDLAAASTAIDGERIRSQAVSAALALENDLDKLREMALLVGSKYTDVEEEKDLMVFDVLQLAKNDSAKFMQLMDSPDTKYRALLKAALDKGVVTMQGLFFKFGSRLIGNSEDKAVKTLMDDDEIYNAVVKLTTVG